MRLYEILNEAAGDFVSAKEAGISGQPRYHGTTSSNLSKILRNGLQPRPNKWFHSNKYQHSITKFAPNKRKEASELSTTDDLDKAKSYALQGGSTGWGDETGGVVLGFTVVDSDMVCLNGFDTNETVFKNKITPDRLKIVYPTRLVGKEPEYKEKSDQANLKNIDKLAQLKEINKKLKAAGSDITVKSLNPRSARVTLYKDGARFGMNNYDVGTPEFNTWLEREISDPLTVRT